MKTLNILTATLIILLSCKSAGEEKISTLTTKEASAAERFEDFNAKFHTDSAFQVTRISFPLEGQQIDAFEEREWSPGNWQLMKMPVSAPIDTLELKRSLERTDSSVSEEIWVEDSGFRVERTFKLREGKWFLVSYNDINL